MKKLKSAFGVILILILFIFIAFMTFSLAEPKAYDYMTKTFLTNSFDKNKKVYGSDNIVLVVIDSKTVEKYRWPWKRELNCKIFDYFSEYAKPKVVAHDAILATLDTENPDSDKKFFKSLSKIDNLIVGFQDWDNQAPNKKYEEDFVKKFGVKIDSDSKPTVQLIESLIQYPKPYFESIRYAGFVKLYPGFIKGRFEEYAMDEVYRNCEYFVKFYDSYLPSIALRAFMIANNNPSIKITDNEMIFPELNYKVSQLRTYYQRINPIRFYKLYDNGYSHTKYSAVDIMDSYDAIKAGKKPLIHPDEFKDKIVVIGANVPAGTGLNDNKNTPVSVNHPGVDIQATLIDNIVNNDFVRVLPDWANILITILGMLLIFGIIKFLDLYKSIAGTILTFFCYFIVSAICFYNQIIISVITPIVMFVLTTIIAYTHKYVIENRNKEKVKSAMGKYMSEDVMKDVVKNIDNLGLGGKKSTVTVLFADIRGFTSLSEKLSAQQVSELLNEYFTEMEPIISKYNGVINKFIGDAIMAIFGEPIQDENHAQNAVKCGYEMLMRVQALQKKWRRERKPEIQIGIGINTGEVFVGNIGSVNRMEYTVIGDTVNLASRLESYNKIYQTKFLISPSVYVKVKSFVDVLKISDVHIRGKANKMDIYEILRVHL